MSWFAFMLVLFSAFGSCQRVSRVRTLGFFESFEQINDRRNELPFRLADGKGVKFSAKLNPACSKSESAFLSHRIGHSFYVRPARARRQSQTVLELRAKRQPQNRKLVYG